MPNISVGMILKDIQENLKKTKNQVFIEKISQIICLLPDLPQKEVSFFKKNIQDPHKTSTNKFFELFKKKIPSGSQRLHASNTANQQRKAILEWVLENTGWEPGNDQQWSYSSKGKLTKIPPEIRVPSLLKSIQDTTTQPKKDPYILVLHKICLLINEKKTQCEEIANSDEFKQSLLENKEKKAIPRRANLVNNGPIKPDLSVEANLNLAPLLSESESIEKNDQSETTDASSAASFEKRTIDQGNKSLTEESFTKEETPDFIVNKSNSRTKLSDLTKKLKLTITEINDKHKIFVTNIDKASNSLQRAINELNQMNEKTQLYKQFQESIDQSDDLEEKIDLSHIDTKEENKISIDDPDKENDDFRKLLEESNSAIRNTQEDTQRIKRLLDEQFDSLDEKFEKEVNPLFFDQDITEPDEDITELLEGIKTDQQTLQDKEDEIDTLNQAQQNKEETIKQLNELNAQLTENKEDSNQKITALTNQVEELKTKLKEENNAHQQALQDKDHEIKKLNQAQQNKEETIKQLNELNAQLTENKEDSNQKITELTNQLKEDQKNISQQVEELKTKLEEENNAHQQALHNKIDLSHIDTKEENKISIDDPDKENDDFRKLLEESNSAIRNTQEDTQRIKRLLDEQQFDSLDEEFEKEVNPLFFDQDITELLEEIKTDQQTLQDKEDEIDTLNQAHKQQEETIKQLNELNAQLTKNKEDSNQEITALKNQVEELETKLKEENNAHQQALQDKNAQLTENKEDSNQKITALKNQLQEAEKNQKNISQQVEELKTELEEKNNDHKQALKDKKDEIDTLNQAHKQQEETIKQLNAQLTENKEDSNQKITALKNQLQEAEKNQKNISQQVEELKTELEEKNNDHKQALKDKKDEIDTLNQAQQKQEETIKQLNELNAQLTKNKEDSNQEITALKNQLQEAEKNQKNISQQVEELKTELEEKNNDHKQALKDKKDEIDTLNQAHKQQEETIKQLNELNAQLTKNKEDSNQKITALTNQVEELETKLKEENNAHQQALQDKDHEIDTLKTDDQQQKEIIKTLTTAKDTFQQALQDKKDEIDRLKEKLEEQETNITTLENQLKRDQDNLNHKITKLNQEIESKNKIISDFKNLSKNKTKEQSVQTEHSIEPSRGTTKVDLQSQSLTDQPSITDNDEGNYKSKKIGTMDKDTLSENQPPFSDSTDSDGDSDTESYVSCLQNQHSLASDSEESDIGPQDNPDSGYDSSDTEERKGQSQFDYNHLKNFPSLAKIISSEINKDHCDDITELDTFNVSKKTKGVFFPNISDQKREEILTNEKNNLEQKFNERLAKLWKDYAEKPTISRDELQRLFSAFEGDINQIKKECFNNLLEKVKKDLDEEGFVFNEKSCDDLFAEYLKWIKPTQDRIISAGHYQTSPLLNQLKIKISPFHCTAAEEAENEFKKYGLHLKKENPTVLGTSIGFSLSEKELKDLILDKLEKRLPLEFYLKTFQLDSFAQKVCSTAVENGFGLAAHLLAIILIILIMTKNRESDEQKITNALVSVIKENQLAINPDEVKIELKLTDSDQKNTGKKDYTVLRPLLPIESKYQEQIKEANAKLKEEKKNPKLARKIIVEPTPEPEASTSTSCKLN